MNILHRQPKTPKPDIYCGFSIYDPKLYSDYGFGKDNFIQNFTVDTLFQLKGKGLCSTPISAFATRVTNRMKPNKQDDTIPTQHLLCFPWAVVELKRFEDGNNNQLTTKAYCQAANAGSTALCMLEKLAQFAEIKKNNQHIPPILTATCVGGESKVWLAYSRLSTNNQRDHVRIYK